MSKFYDFTLAKISISPIEGFPVFENNEVNKKLLLKLQELEVIHPIKSKYLSEEVDKIKVAVK